MSPAWSPDGQRDRLLGDRGEQPRHLPPRPQDARRAGTSRTTPPTTRRPSSRRTASTSTTRRSSAAARRSSASRSRTRRRSSRSRGARAATRTPSFSPDGKRLYYASSRGGIFNIYGQDLATGEIVQYTDVIGAALGPAAFIGPGRAGEGRLLRLPGPALPALHGRREEAVPQARREGGCRPRRSRPTRRPGFVPVRRGLGRPREDLAAEVQALPRQRGAHRRASTRTRRSSRRSSSRSPTTSATGGPSSSSTRSPRSRTSGSATSTSATASSGARRSTTTGATSTATTTRPATSCGTSRISRDTGVSLLGDLPVLALHAPRGEHRLREPLARRPPRSRRTPTGRSSSSTSRARTTSRPAGVGFSNDTTRYAYFGPLSRPPASTSTLQYTPSFQTGETTLTCDTFGEARLYVPLSRRVLFAFRVFAASSTRRGADGLLVRRPRHAPRLRLRDRHREQRSST